MLSLVKINQASNHPSTHPTTYCQPTIHPPLKQTNQQKWWGWGCIKERKKGASRQVRKKEEKKEGKKEREKEGR